MRLTYLASSLLISSALCMIRWCACRLSSPSKRVGSISSLASRCHSRRTGRQPKLWPRSTRRPTCRSSSSPAASSASGSKSRTTTSKASHKHTWDNNWSNSSLLWHHQSLWIKLSSSSGSMFQLQRRRGSLEERQLLWLLYPELLVPKPLRKY